MVQVVFTNIDAFWRSLFPVFMGKFEAFYIFMDIFTIYACFYCFIWLLNTLTGGNK